MAWSASSRNSGVPAPGVLAPFVAGLELVGGMLLILGVATRWISLPFRL